MSSPPLTFEDDLPHVRSDLLRGIGGYWCEFCGEHMPESNDPMGAFRKHLAAVLLAHVREAGQRPSPEQMGDAEGDAWDELHGDSDVICTCDGCNFYSPTYDGERECSLNAHIEAIVAARLRALTEGTR